MAGRRRGQQESRTRRWRGVTLGGAHCRSLRRAGAGWRAGVAAGAGAGRHDARGRTRQPTVVKRAWG